MGDLLDAMLTEKLLEYDDLERQIPKTFGMERTSIIMEMKEIGEIISKLLEEVPNKEGEIKIVTGKVQ